MNYENGRKAYTKEQFEESGFDASGYKYNAETGNFTGTLVIKRWCKEIHALIAYIDFDDGRKIEQKIYPANDYLGITTIKMGSKVKLKYAKSPKTKATVLVEIQEVIPESNTDETIKTQNKKLDICLNINTDNCGYSIHLSPLQKALIVKILGINAAKADQITYYSDDTLINCFNINDEIVSKILA